MRIRYWLAGLMNIRGLSVFEFCWLVSGAIYTLIVLSVVIVVLVWWI